jgi:hypothetical protein
MVDKLDWTVLPKDKDLLEETEVDSEVDSEEEEVDSVVDSVAIETTPETQATPLSS